MEDTEDIVFNAYRLARVAHNGQKRKYNGRDYIEHPIRIYERILERSDLTKRQKDIMCAAALLHDVLEDCPEIVPEEIEQNCGSSVLRIVEELTNPSKGCKELRAIRKQMDRDHLKGVSWEAKIIKLYDRIDNIEGLSECPDSKFISLYLNETKSLLEVLGGTDKILEGQLKELVETYGKSEGK